MTEMRERPLPPTVSDCSRRSYHCSSYPVVLACTIEPRALQLAAAGTGGGAHVCSGQSRALCAPRCRATRVDRHARARRARVAAGRNARRARWIGRPAPIRTWPPHPRGAHGAGRPRGRRPRRALSVPFCSVHGHPDGGCLRLRALCRTYGVPFLAAHAQDPERAEPAARRSYVPGYRQRACVPTTRLVLSPSCHYFS
jgi:hypothetical protein